MKSFWQPINRQLLCIVLLSTSVIQLQAEGTPQVAPNQNITINGNFTNDIAALHIDNDDYSNFASYNNMDVNSRLYIHITDPEKECIYLGFSNAHLNNTSQNPTPQNFEYRVLDPAGNVVFGPRVVLATDAQIQNWSEAVAGPDALNAGGYAADLISSADLMSQSWSGDGDYYIEFRNLNGNDPFLIDYWDITVVDCSGAQTIEKPGRIWSKNWAIFAINDFGFPNRPFNGSFYVCAPDPVDPESAFITQIDFNGSGFRPAAFNVAFNSTGTMNTGNISEDRKSVENMNLTRPEYAIFLNDPVDICKTAEGGQIELNGISSCDGENFCINYISTRSGQVDLLLDFNGGDGVFTPGTEDLMLTDVVINDQVGEEMCLEWDGLDGLGQSVADQGHSEVPIVLSFAQGIYHFPIYDAELMTDGFTIKAIRPGGDDPLLYYDDSNISVSSESGEPAVQLAGCDLPCHRWTNYTTPNTVGFGNLNTINSWWFSQQVKTENILVTPAILTTEIEGPENLCEGDTISLMAINNFEPDANAVEILNQTWLANGVLAAEDTDVLDIVEGGLYEYLVEWTSDGNDTCSANAMLSVTELPVSSFTIDTTIMLGDTLIVNDEGYAKQGRYIQTLIASNGCDSTLIIELEVIEPMYTCEILGESPLCFGDTTILRILPILDPPEADSPRIHRIEWSGPGISGQVEQDSLIATREGSYLAVLTWVNSRGILDFTQCTFELDLNPRFATTIDTLILEGETIEINGLQISEAGQYQQLFTSQNGCDSTIFINVISQNSVVLYDFDDCKSSDYERFQAEYPNPVICGELEASNVFRNQPDVNLHSCTPGQDGGEGVCVSSSESCSFTADDDRAIRFNLVVYPQPDSVIQITSLNFLERAPEMYVWTTGGTGVNNYPLFYGIRVLKNGTEIFRSEDIPTSTNWSREIFNFIDNDDFLVETPSLFEFELLGYCLAGFDSTVTAWDIDNLSIQASCGLPESNRAVVSGRVERMDGLMFENLEVELEDMSSGVVLKRSMTDSGGGYVFDNVMASRQYRIRAEHDYNHLEGVSTLDIIQIQRHILGMETFKNAYQWIAADADNSGTVSAMDLLVLKKLILGITDEFPNNTSWRFHNSRQDLDITNVFDFEEYIELNKPKGTVVKQDLTAIKTGDVSGLLIGPVNKSNELGTTVSMRIEDQKLKKGTLSRVRISIDAEAAIAGLQMCLSASDYSLKSIGLEENGIVNNIGHHLDGNLLKIVHYNVVELLDSEDLAIVMDIVPHRDAFVSEMVGLESSILKSELYGWNGEASPVEIEFTDGFNGFTAYAYPNPFNTETTINIRSTADQTAVVKIFNMAGQLLCKLNTELHVGRNSVTITEDMIQGAEGMLICELQTAESKELIKIIRY